MQRPHSVGLKIFETMKMNPWKWLHIFDTFEHSWLCCKHHIFDTCLASRWRCNLFRSKLEFWAEIFCRQSLCEKKLVLGAIESIFCSKLSKTKKIFYCIFCLKIKNGQNYWELCHSNMMQAVSSHKNQSLMSFTAFSKILTLFWNFKFCSFEFIFGQEMDSKTSSANSFHISIVHKKFQLKIPI